MIYDPASGGFKRTSIRPALFGKRSVRLQDGREISCRPAFAALATLAVQHRAETSATVTGVPAEKVREAARLLAANRPVSMYMHNGVGQHTNATQTSWAIATLYALLGDIDRQGGNVVFRRRRRTWFPAKNSCRRKWPSSELAESESHSGPPASRATALPTIFLRRFSMAAPIRSRHFLNFGSNTIMNTGDSQRAREAFRALDFAVAAEFS